MIRLEFLVSAQSWYQVVLTAARSTFVPPVAYWLEIVTKLVVTMFVLFAVTAGVRAA